MNVAILILFAVGVTAIIIGSRLPRKGSHMALRLIWPPPSPPSEDAITREQAFAAKGVYGSGSNDPVLCVQPDFDTGDLESRRVGAAPDFLCTDVEIGDVPADTMYRRLSEVVKTEQVD